jgi:26S proteasome regulatory subunit N2
MGGSNLTSATGIISALDDEQPEIKEFALQKLNDIVNEFWAEISASISKIEILHEDETFKARQLAALVASKVYFHLEQYDEAMNYALGAGKLFDVSQASEYVDTIVAKCIDQY